MSRKKTLAALLVAFLGASLNSAYADDVCSAAEYQASNAKLASAKAAESQGNLEEALRLANASGGCVKDTAGLRRLIIGTSYALGQAAEDDGKLEAAFGYYRGGMSAEQYENPKSVDLFANAKRVMLERVAKSPADRRIAREALEFMHREDQSAEVAYIVKHMDSQARRLLAEEEKAFSTSSPHRELLVEAEDWLQEQRLTGVPESTNSTAAQLTARWIARGDQFAALDTYSALANALSYYGQVERKDKEAAVRTKAGKLADGLAGGTRWAEAVRLYELAEDSQKAEALTARREAGAAEVEAERKQKFDEEQDELEKELGF